jgi:hypothetical protein
MEVAISDRCERRGTKIYGIEISPSLYMMIEKHPTNHDDHHNDDLDLEFLSESESRVDLSERPAEKSYSHRDMNF